MLEMLKGLSCVYILYILIDAIWQIAEKEMYGQITPRRIDDYVALVLAVSLYFNLRRREES